MPKFSVVLIARNEIKTLPKLMNSLSEFKARGGEVILVDTGSTDGTAAFARDMDCKVAEVGDRFRVLIDESSANKINELFVEKGDENIVSPGDTLFDYSAARNFAATLASNDVIATPDCDEVYTKFDIDEIEKRIEAGVDQLEYNFVFAHDDVGNEMIKFLHCKFYNKTKLQWVNIIHEVLSPINGNEARREFLPESIIKLEHWQNHETNRGHYLKGLAFDCLQSPNNDRNAHYFGRELMYTGRFRSAIKQLTKHVEMKRWPTEASQSMVFIGDCFAVLGEFDNAIAAWSKAFDMEPNRREPLMKLAEHYYRQNKPMQCAAYAAAATQIKGDNYYANYQPYYENLPHELLYWAYWNLNDLNSSLRHFNAAQGYQPLNPKYLHDMRFYYDLPYVTFVIPTLKRPEGLERCIASIKALNYPQEKIQILFEEDEPRIGVPKRVKSMVEKSTGEWIVFASNDIEFTPDSLIIAFKNSLDNNKKFVSFNTQGEKGVAPDEGNICEHFMIHRSMVKKLNGEIFDTDFNHVGVDNLLWAKMSKIGQAMYAGKAIVNHFHFSQKKSEFDEVYAIGWKEEMVAKDRELLKVKLEELAKKPYNEI